MNRPQYHAEHLNKYCHCISSSASARAEAPLKPFSHMTSETPVFISQSHADEMAALIKLITRVTKDPLFKEATRQFTPSIAQQFMPSSGALFGYDFHLTDEGPKLIEINTNAGAIFPNIYLNKTQSPCCEPVEAFMQYLGKSGDDLDAALVSMFKQEYAAHHPDGQLTTVAIMDESPDEQFLYEEFIAFQRLFESAGIKAFIVDPGELEYNDERIQYQGQTIDLIYNRHTDFYLDTPVMTAVRKAYLANQVVLTPHPYAYGSQADKRLLTLLSDHQFLGSLSLNSGDVERLHRMIPEAKLVNADNADALWQERKKWFFKPATGYGSKAAYRGAKLSKKVWRETILKGEFIAQSFAPPSERVVKRDSNELRYKTDYRNYAYNGDVLLLTARLYQGQTTNMKTPGGGFASVFAA